MITQKYFVLIYVIILISCGSEPKSSEGNSVDRNTANSMLQQEQLITEKSENDVASGVKNTDQEINDSSPEITFIELGSVNCIPCKKMQPVMAAIEKKYGDQIEVIFYDVWQPDQKKYASEYGIQIIPTQIFLDKNGSEIARHQGFYSESQIDKLLQNHGLKIIQQ